MNNTVRLGLIGLGKMGQNHLRNLVMIKNVELVFVYDVNIETGKKIAKQYNVEFSENLENSLKTIDAVVIVTPTNTHFDYINRVSEFVRNIFVEKPLTDSLETSLKIKRLAEEKKLNIQTGFIERYNSAVVAMKKVLKNSENVINIDFSRTNKVSSRITDVDVVIDLMIHDIDLALFFNGKAHKIDAHGYMKNNMIEYARAIITHENGSFSNIVASRITEKRIRHISATCEDMYVDCNLLSKEVFVNKQTIEQYLENVSITSKEETIDVRPQEGLLLELIDFLDMSRNQEIKVPSVSDAVNAIEVAEKIQYLIKNG